MTIIQNNNQSLAVQNTAASSYHFVPESIEGTTAIAQQLRTLLTSIESAYFDQTVASQKAGSPLTMDLVDVRRAAPGLVILPAPTWSEPQQRFLVQPELGERLRRASYGLPSNLKIGFWEGYRPLTVQKALWDTGFTLLEMAYPSLNPLQIEAVLETFIARPNASALHGQGRAVDIAVLDESGNILDPESADGHLAYNLFADALSKTGLSNYDKEWWHWYYGPDETIAATSHNIPACHEPSALKDSSHYN